MRYLYIVGFSVLRDFNPMSLVLIMAIFIGVYFTVYFNFPQVRFFFKALNILRKDKFFTNNSHTYSLKQLFLTSIVGMVGVGNITGVATAIYFGGPTSLFWMILAAFFAMSTKLIEVSLVHKYRKTNDKGRFYGGTMYVIKEKMNFSTMATLFSVMTIVVAVLLGAIPQVQIISHAISLSFDLDINLVVFLIVLFVGFILLFGFKKIVRFIEVVFPVVAFSFIIVSLFIIISNYQNILPSLKMIFLDVLSPDSIIGGFIGTSIAYSISNGSMKSIQSNEAGLGSSAMLYVKSDEKNSIKVGLVAMLEPFIDTILICFLSGLLILSSGSWNEKNDTILNNDKLVILAKHYHDTNSEDVKELSDFLLYGSRIKTFSGDLLVEKGEMLYFLSVIHNKSLAEDILFFDKVGNYYSGRLKIIDGEIQELDKVLIKGKSIIKEDELMLHIFSENPMGFWGKGIFILLIFFLALTTIVVWGYYGGVAFSFLFTKKYIKLYYLSFLIITIFSMYIFEPVYLSFGAIAFTLMALPNVICIMVCRKEIKKDLKEFANKKSTK